MIEQREIDRKLNALLTPQKRKRSFFHLKIAAAVASAIMFIPAAHYIDTRIFPVVSDAHALIFDASDPAQTNLAIIYNKNRNCEIVSADFFLNGSAIRMIRTEGGAPLLQRPIGKNRSRTFTLNVPRETFIDHGVIQFVHRCHPLWLHQKVLYQ
jgi:hypothetical protein